MPFEGVRVQRERITKQDIEAHLATLECPGVQGPPAHSDQCGSRMEASPKQHHNVQNVSLVEVM